MPLAISAEARGIVRLFKADLAKKHKAWEAAWSCEEAYYQTERWLKAGQVGSLRAERWLTKNLGQPERLSKALIWKHLRPRSAVIQDQQDAGYAQNAVVIDYLVAGNLGSKCNLEAGLWSLEVPDHALQRMVQRASKINLRNALLEAHRNILAADTGILNRNNIIVRSGPGAFIGDIIQGHDTTVAKGFMVFYRPRTWLHEDQLRPDQEPVGPGARPLGEIVMAPLPLRNLQLLAA